MDYWASTCKIHIKIKSSWRNNLPSSWSRTEKPPWSDYKEPDFPSKQRHNLGTTMQWSTASVKPKSLSDTIGAQKKALSSELNHAWSVHPGQENQSLTSRTLDDICTLVDEPETAGLSDDFAIVRKIQAWKPNSLMIAESFWTVWSIL